MPSVFCGSCGFHRFCAARVIGNGLRISLKCFQASEDLHSTALKCRVSKLENPASADVALLRNAVKRRGRRGVLMLRCADGYVR